MENTVQSNTNKSLLVIGSIFAAGTILLIIVAIVCMSRKKIDNQRQNGKLITLIK